MTRQVRRRRSAFVIWWHRHVLNHQIDQWGVRVPTGVAPLRHEVVHCTCGVYWDTAKR